MDPNSRALIMGAAGAAGGGPKIYVEDVFSTWLYTGNGSTQTITNGIDLSGKGGLVWIKQRGAADAHQLRDTERGGNWLLSNGTQGQQTSSTSDGTITSYNSDGFTLGNAGGNQTPNGNGYSFVSWTFRKAAKFFDVVTYTGNGASTRSINHSLGSTPGCIIAKRTDTASQWYVWHRNYTGAGLYLNNSSVFPGDTAGFNTSQSSTTIDLVSNSVNVNNATYVAYLFAHDAGGFGDSGNDSVISCGSYTADSGGNATVNLGWEPQFVLFKRTDASSNWTLADSMRGLGAYYTETARLFANVSDAESSSVGVLSLTSTGFTTVNSYTPGSATYIYIAIRRGPMKTPTDATKVFATQATRGAGNGTATANLYTSNFPVDLLIEGGRSSGGEKFHDRLRGFDNYLLAYATNAESGSGSSVFRGDDVDGIYSSITLGASSGDCGWMFRRAPGFFDVVAYTGTGSARTVSHSLGVAPELIIVKSRSNNYSWPVYAAPTFNPGQGGVLALNELGDASYGTQIFGDTVPTMSVFYLGGPGSALSNDSGSNYIAYLFASCPGVSKIGSYTGNGGAQSFNCGFTNGVRLVLIKRTDASGNWLVGDSARGIAGNDPLLYLNSTAAELTTVDWIDPYSSGFFVIQESTANANVNGATYIYLAIA